MKTRRLVVTFDIEIDVDEKYAEWTAEEIVGQLAAEIRCSPGPIFAWKVNQYHAAELKVQE